MKVKLATAKLDCHKLTLRSSELMYNIKKSKFLLLLLLPGFIYYLIFCYVPMYGIVMAFQNFLPGKPILQSEWGGLKWFYQYFNSIYFHRTLRNTLLINVYYLFWGFPMPIIFALLLNEIKDGLFKRSIQTISYLPHFISTVVLAGIVVNFLSPSDGIINLMITKLGGKPVNFLNEPGWFRTIYITSSIWASFGWNSIIYIASISSINPELYQAASIDGANRWHMVIYITLPDIAPTMITLLILSLGGLLSVGYEKIILLYNSITYETADVISTYVYRRGILDGAFSFGTAVGLFNSVINFIFIITANWLSKKVTKIALW